MKKAKLFSYKNLLLIGLLVTVLAACSKKLDDPAPSNDSNNNNNNNNIPSTGSTEMCDDSICNLPYRVFSSFIPSGFYDTGEQTTTLTFDSCGETPKYPNEGLRIVYTNHGGYWGAHFLNNNNWGGTFKISPKAKKITFYVKTDYSANVTFNAFGNATYGKVELYKLSSPVTPQWEKITITLSGKPTTFSAPLNIIIDGVTTSGAVTVVDIKDLLIE